jgi:hypothetical protein
MERMHRYDYILIAVLISSSYAISHLMASNPAYAGVWMIYGGAAVALWFFREGLSNVGNLIHSGNGEKEEARGAH